MWLKKYLLIVLLAGQAFGQLSSTTPSTITTGTTAAQTSTNTTTEQTEVFYFLDVTVDVTGPRRNETEITAWLDQIFRSKLGECLFSNTGPTTAASTSPQTLNVTEQSTTPQIHNSTTTAFYNVTQNFNSTTNATTDLNGNMTTAATTLNSNDTTTAATTLNGNNTTTAATTLNGNNTTTAATTLNGNNTTTAATTLNGNNTTTAATTLNGNNTTTAATTLNGNNTTTAATTLNGNNTTTAATTLNGNNTTTAATTLNGNNTTTAATTLNSNETTTAATALNGNNTTTSGMLNGNDTTAATTLNGNDTTTAATVLNGNNTTTALNGNNTTTAATMLNGNNTTTVATVLNGNNTSTATTMLNGNNTTTATSALNGNNTTTATSALNGNNTTTATSALNGNNTTTVATVLNGNNTTTATSVLNGNNATTATTMLNGNNTTTATSALNGNNTTTVATVLNANKTTTATTLNGNNTTTATSALNSNNTTTAAPTMLNDNTTKITASQSNSPTTATSSTSKSNNPTTSVTSTTLTNNSPMTTQTTKGRNTNGKNSRRKRFAREINSNLPQSSNDSSLLFQGMEISCTSYSKTNQTKCTVLLKLSNKIPSCCILQTLCAASKNSSDIHMVGHRVDERIHIGCNESSGEPNSCIYSGPLGASCEESGPKYVITTGNSTVCGTGECNCSSHCNRSDAYFTLSISLQNSTMNSSFVTSLISKLGQTPNCSIDINGTCQLLATIASEYRSTSVNCERTATKEICRVILGFAQEVPICSVADAVWDVFLPEEKIHYDGRVRRAAICGSEEISASSLDYQFTYVDRDLKRANFCSKAEGSNLLKCKTGENLLVNLKEDCVSSFIPTTTAPNVTINSNMTDLNATTSPNVTISQNVTTLNTTASPNVTISQNVTTLNTTASPNVTISQNVTTLNTTASPNVTISQNVTTLNTTASPNVTISQNVTTLNTTASPNVTISQNVTTLNTTASPNVTISQNVTTLNTTASPNVTISQNVTTLNTTASPNVTISQNVTTLNTTASPNVTISQNVTTLNTTTNPNMTNSFNVTTVNPSNHTSSPGNNTTTSGKPTSNTTDVPVSVTTTGISATNGDAESQAKELLALTEDVSKLTTEQIEQLVSKLEKLLSGPTVSKELGDTSVNIVSNLLDASEEKLSSSSDRIIGIVDTVGLKLVIEESTESLLYPSLAVSVKPTDGTNFQETIFSITDPTNVLVRGNPRLKRSMAKDSSIPQGSITLPPSLTQNLTIEEQQLISRVQFNFYQKSSVFQDGSLGEKRLNSGILGASVANLSIKGLEDNVVIRLRNIEPVPANFVAVCVFWDFAFNDGLGGWNSDGCFVQKSTDNETVCGCSHLTSFAILLDLSRETLTSRLQATILTFITYIGCGLSAIFLSITLLTYLSFGKLRKDIPSKILIQLCLALLLLNLVFLVDAWLALYPEAVGLCISTAWFLHYFLLVSFTWMGLEGVHMYYALVKVFNDNISHYMLKFSLVGWGVPMIVVIIVIAIDKNNYGLVSYGKFSDGTSDDFCWIRNDIAFYVAVVAYFCVIFLFNFIMFIVVLVQLHRIKKQNPHNNKHRSTLQDVRSVLGITLLLGLTWGFAFFAWGPVNLAFMYLFAIFNSLQGFFIFVFHCLVKETVRRQWRTYLCCGKMRLSENSEWSRTATQKNTKKSPLTSFTSSQSSRPSSTSFLPRTPSLQMNGIGNPLEDRIITADEEPRTDVVLNEINSQLRNRRGS